MKIDSRKKLYRYLDEQFNHIRRNNTEKITTSKFFGEVGSTQIEDIEYSDQLEVKRNSLCQIFSPLLTESQVRKYKIIKSPTIKGYRFRMDYVTSHNPIHKPHDRFGQRRKGNFSWVIDMDEDHLIDQKWFAATREIYLFAKTLRLSNYDLKTHIGFLRYFVLRTHKGNSMLNIITSSSENSEIMEEVAQLALEKGFQTVYWQVNDSIGDDSSGETIKYWGDEYLRIGLNILNRQYSFHLGPDNFFQNNILLFEQLMSDLKDKLKFSDSNLVDLFCGVGTIGIMLADKFKSVLGVDIVKSSIDLAKENAVLNKVTNVSYKVMDLYQEIDPEVEGGVKNSTLVVDPPRSGLMQNGIELIQSTLPKEVIYISCNPITQLNDLEQLKNLYKIVWIQGYDMFPHTYHVENVAILERIN